MISECVNVSAMQYLLHWSGNNTQSHVMSNNKQGRVILV